MEQLDSTHQQVQKLSKGWLHTVIVTKDKPE